MTARTYFRRKDGRIITKLIPKKAYRFTSQSVRAVAVDSSFEMTQERLKYATLEFLQQHSARDFMTSGQFIVELEDEPIESKHDDINAAWATSAHHEYDFDVSQVSANEKRTLTEINYFRLDDFESGGDPIPIVDCWVENEARERIDLGSWERVDIDLVRYNYSGTLYEPEFYAHRLSSDHDLSVDLSIGLSGHNLFRPIAESDLSRLTTVFSVSD